MPTYTEELRQDIYLRSQRLKYIKLKGEDLVATVTITTKKQEPPDSVKRRIHGAAKGEMKRYADIITKELAVLDEKVEALAKKGEVDDARRMVQRSLGVVDGAVGSMESAVRKAVEKLLAQERQDDKNLREARVKVVCSVVSIVLSATSIGLAAASGAIVPGLTLAFAKEILGLAALIYKSAKLIRNSLKSTESKRFDLLDAMGEYFKAHRKMVMYRQEVGNDQGRLTKRQFDYISGKLKPKAREVERATQEHRNDVTRLRHTVDDVSREIGRLRSKIGKLKSHKAITKMRNQLDLLERESIRLEDQYDSWLKFSNDMKGLLAEAELKVDDRTLRQRAKRLKLRREEVYGAASEAYGFASTLYAIGKDIASLAA